MPPPLSFFLFFFNDTATTEIYTLSLHDALPISHPVPSIFLRNHSARAAHQSGRYRPHYNRRDRKSTRLNSSHQIISYAVFCLKKKKKRKHREHKHNQLTSHSTSTRLCASASPYS